MRRILLTIQAVDILRNSFTDVEYCAITLAFDRADLPHIYDHGTNLYNSPWRVS